MIDFPLAQRWLNRFGHSHIDPRSQADLDATFDLNIALVDRALALNRIIFSAAISSDPWEHPEVLLFAAAFALDHGQDFEAHTSLVLAYQRYQALPSSEHQVGIVLWLLGLVEWRLHQNRDACDRWRAARSQFARLSEVNREIGDNVRADWYAEKAMAMSVDLACTPEEGYLWITRINQLENAILGQAQNNLQAQLQNNILAGDVGKVNECIARLLRLADVHRGNLAEGSAYLECGLAKYQIGDLKNAYRLMGQAVRSYHPDNLRQALARWMLGAMQWKDDLEDKAIKNWLLCWEDFRLLRQRANWDKDLVRLNWYGDIKPLMDLAFEQMVQA